MCKPRTYTRGEVLSLFRISLTSWPIDPLLRARMLRIPTDDILSDT